MLISDEKAVYHVMSRTALGGFPLDDVEKEFMLGLLRRFSDLYFTEILGFCLMGNHFHLLVKMFPDSRYSDEEIKKRLTYIALRPSGPTTTKALRIWPAILSAPVFPPSA